MWELKENKWEKVNGDLDKSNYNVIRQDLEDIRFYSKCLKGISYNSIDNLSDLYSVLNVEKDWTFANDLDFSITGNTYSHVIDETTIDSEWLKFNTEYGMTLKTNFTPEKVINDSLKNFIQVDLATTEMINLNETRGIKIDGKLIKNGQKILVKDQIDLTVLSNNVDPNTFFISNFYPTEDGTSPNTEYFFYNENNGIYEVQDNQLIKLEFSYDEIVNKSIYVKLGNNNRDKQYKLSRLLNGFYPEFGQPMEFLEKKNWLVRNEFQYQDIFEININSSIEDIDNNRKVFVGDFGSIFIWDNNSERLNLIRNKFKVNLTSIDQIDDYYIAVGEKGTILRIDKDSLNIEIIEKGIFDFTSVDFFNNKRGIVCGFESIYYTNNSGRNWEKIEIENSKNHRYNSVNYWSINSAYIVGDNGIIINLSWENNNWTSSLKIYEKIENPNEIFENVWDYKKSFYDSDKGHFFLGEQIIYRDLMGNIFFIENDQLIKDIEIISDNIYLIGSSFKLLDFNSFTTIPDSNIITASSSVIDNNSYNSIEKDSNDNLDITGDHFIITNYDVNLDEFNSLTDDFETTSRLMFLDYDIGSKLNFYKNNEYRLPNSEIITVSNTSVVSGISQIEFYSKSNETSWLDYYKDILKEEYDGNNIEFNHIFSVTSDDQTTVTSATGIDGLFGTISSTFSSSETLHLGYHDNENWMVIKNDSIDIEESDVISIESDILDGRFICVNVKEINGQFYSYFKTRFNMEIEQEFFNNSDSIIINNLNKFNINAALLSELYQKMNKHYIGDGYLFNEIDNRNVTQNLSIIGSESDIEVNPLYNNKTAYYNLELNIVDNRGRASNSWLLEYDENFLNFGYTPQYNILDFLSSVDPLFTPTYEFLALPQFAGIEAATYPILDSSKPILVGPLKDVGIQSSLAAKNIISFSEDYKSYWETLWVNTFVDINFNELSPVVSYNFEKLLIIEKGWDQESNRYYIKFNKEIDVPSAITGEIDILSRRKLEQISHDLNELNNIQTNFDNDRLTYRKKLNFKFYTDSYSRVLLSDKNIKDNLSGIVYTDYNNNLSSNITNIEKKLNFNVEVVDDSGVAKLIFDSTDNIENIKISDYLILSDSSPNIYSGYHLIDNIDYDNNEITLSSQFLGNSTVTVTYYDFDRNLFFLPTDLIDIGIDAKSKISVDIKPDMVKVSDKFELVNIDTKKFRFNLIDGLTLGHIVEKFPWLLEAELTDATIGQDEDGPIFYKGIWECGRWFKGKWMSGQWLSGQWYDGIFNSYQVSVNKISADVDFNVKGDGSFWYNGDFRGGIMNYAQFYGGTFVDGKSFNLNWFDGTHQNGEWTDGHFKSGLWIDGIWNSGIFEATQGDSIWLSGTWLSGDFKNGQWLNGKFSNRKGLARFGVNPTNSRKAIWEGGEWVSGEIHSILNKNINDITIPSDNHKFTIFKTGKINNIDFWGGTLLVSDFNMGNFIDGICKPIDSSYMSAQPNNNEIYLNNRWYFRRNDKIWLTDSSDNQWEEHMINNVIYDIENDITTVILYDNITLPITQNLSIVTRFKDANWVNGVMFNSIFLSNIFSGGMWLNGYFGSNAKWG